MSLLEVSELLKARGVLKTDGHFVYPSGNHGTDLVSKEQILSDPILVADLCLEMAKRFQDDNIEIVVGLPPGGVILAQVTAYHLSILTDRKVLFVISETSTGSGSTLNRGYVPLVRGKRVLIIDDFVDTKESTDTVRRFVITMQTFKSNPVGVGVICNRDNPATGGLRSSVSKFVSLVELDKREWQSGVCRRHGPCFRNLAIENQPARPPVLASLMNGQSHAV